MNMDNDVGMKLHENSIPVPFVAQLLEYHEIRKLYGDRPLNARYTQRQKEGDAVRRKALPLEKRKRGPAPGTKQDNPRPIGGKGLPATVLNLLRKTRGHMLRRDIADLLGHAYNVKRIGDALADLVRGGLVEAQLVDGRKYRYRAA